jgi:hypothetical protein
MDTGTDRSLRRLVLLTFLAILVSTATFAVEIRMGHVSAWILGVPSAAVIAAVIWVWQLRGHRSSLVVIRQVMPLQVTKKGYWVGIFMPAVLIVVVMTALRLPWGLTWLVAFLWFLAGLALQLAYLPWRARRSSGRKF